MAATKFVPLNSRLIDEGEFLGDVDQELRELQVAISKFRRLYGEKAKDAKAKLTIEIEVKIEDCDEDAYSIKTTMKATHPKRPASVSIAMGGETEDGELALFVRTAGSDKTTPRQGKMFTQSGRTIDPITGEVVDEGDE